MRDFRTAERPFCYYGPLPLRKLQRLSQSQYLLPGKGSGTAQGSQIAKDLLGETCPVSGQHYNGARDLFADVPLYPGRGSLCSAQNRLWLPPFSHKRKEKCPHRIVLSRHGVQPQKALDETGKRAFEYPSFQHSGCLASKQLNLFHISRCVRGRAGFVMPWIRDFPTLFAQFLRFRHKNGPASEFFFLRQTQCSSNNYFSFPNSHWMRLMDLIPS